MLHSAFSNALHQNLCVLPDKGRYDKKCATCGMKEECAYPSLFKRQYLEKDAASPLPSCSSPHVFRFANQSHIQIPEKHQFDLGLIIIGDANEKVDYFIHGMKTLGELGIGN